jgi:hypothetical protein
MEKHEWGIKRGAEQYRGRISWVDVAQLAWVSGDGWPALSTTGVEPGEGRRGPLDD